MIASSLQEILESDIGIVVATIFLSVVTPIGEEFTFRGVATTVLLRYGAVVGVVGGAIILRSSAASASSS